MVLLPTVTLRSGTLPPNSILLLRSPQWTDPDILSKTSGTSVCSYLELSLQSIDYWSGVFPLIFKLFLLSFLLVSWCFENQLFMLLITALLVWKD